MSRRGVLLGGAASAVTLLAGGAGGLLLSRGDAPPPESPLARAARTLFGESGAVPNVEPGPVVTGAFISAARRGTEVRWSLMRPPSVAGPLPLVVALHGHGGSTG
ncbi:MAG: esterase, partial [Nocardioides sp.]